jgi:hypothetical protein
MEGRWAINSFLMDELNKNHGRCRRGPTVKKLAIWLISGRCRHAGLQSNIHGYIHGKLRVVLYNTGGVEVTASTHAGVDKRIFLLPRM